MAKAVVKLQKDAAGDVESPAETVEIDVADIALPEGYSLNTPSAPADGYITKAFAAADKQQAIQSRLGNHVTREKAAEDDHVVQAVLARHGRQQVDLQAHEAKWTKERLEPALTQLKQLRRATLHSRLVEAAREAGVDERFLRSPDADTPPPIVLLTENRFGLHEESGRYFERQGDGFAPGSDTSSKTPFGTPRDFFSRISKDEAWRPYFKEQTPQQGGSFNGGSGRQGAVTRKSDLKSVEEKVAYVREHGQEQFEALPA